MDITQVIQNYIKPELIVVAIVLYFIGIGIKKTEKINDKYIPVVLGIIGIIISAIYVIATSTFNGYQTILMAIFTSTVQGILVAGLSVYSNQLIKQAQKDK